VSSACARTTVHRWNEAPAERSIKEATRVSDTLRILSELGPAQRSECVRFHGNYRWPQALSAAQFPVASGTHAELFHYLFTPSTALEEAIAAAKR
jgi:hypothetical protein